MIEGVLPHATQSLFFDRNLIFLNCVSEPSNKSNLELRTPLWPRRTLIASKACSTPITPGTRKILENGF